MGRLLVTGATGFLGGALIRHLHAKGSNPIALGRNEVPCQQLEAEGFDVVRMDLSQPCDPQRFAPFGPVSAIVHCAALSAPWGPRSAFQAANVSGTKHLLRLAGALGVRRFVNISSPTVCFEMKDKENLQEDDPLPPPINAYAATKADAERLVLARADLGPINLRPRGLYGAGDTTLLPRLLTAARKRPLPLFREGAASIDLTHVDDLLSAVDAAFAAPPACEGETFNISGGEPLPVRFIVDRVCAAKGVPVRWRKRPLAPAVLAAKLLERASLMMPGVGEPPVTPYTLGLFAFRQSLDISKAARLLGWRPQIDFETGLAITLGEGKAR
ncbi:NAD(P)-dependent oxidoreductase [Stappia sp. BW2]|uniref:NAD-dependent epimerase/dehydratase family protein n=1 Tax=Stappia sp. BW2 TaxID=2592622 RepID=UPI0011DEB94C|nr:NAD(P)-dependent oxidoreductase [Stappia sp. BW2]TYC79856.1 NAD(P)-dependent oxidoreductase [Stappia sp. BW2]